MNTSTAARSIADVVARAASTRPLIVVLTVAAGIAVGQLLTSPSAAQLAATIFFSALLLIILTDPLLGLLTWIVLDPFKSAYLVLDFGARIPDVTLGRFTVAIVVMLLLAQASIGKRKLTRMSWIDWIMLLTIFGIGQSVTNGTSLSSDLQHFFDFYVTPFLVYFVAKNLVTSERAINRVLLAVFLVGTYSAIYGVYTQLTGDILFADADKLKYQALQYSASLRVMAGLLGSPHVFGMAFNLAIPIAFYRLLKTPSPTKKTMYGIALAILMVAMFLTYKRTAWIAMLAGFTVIQFFYPQFRRLFYVLLLAFVVALALNWGDVNDSAVVTERINYNTETLNGRTDRWEVAIDLWQQKPIAGQGYNQFANLSDHFKAIESHYLNILVSAGLLGFVPYLALMILILWVSIAQYQRTEAGALVPRELIVVFWGVFAAYLVSMYTVIMNNQLMHDMFFLLLGAIVGSQAHLHSAKRKPAVAHTARSYRS